jgi:hypothetical protein
MSLSFWRFLNNLCFTVIKRERAGGGDGALQWLVYEIGSSNNLGLTPPGLLPAVPGNTSYGRLCIQQFNIIYCFVEKSVS